MQGSGEIFRYPVTFFVQVPANSTVNLEYESPGDIMIERLRFLPYTGQERALRVYPNIRYASTGRIRSMLKLGRTADGNETSAYLAGNGVAIDLPIMIDLDQGDHIIVAAENTSNYDYDLDLIFTVSWNGWQKEGYHDGR